MDMSKHAWPHTIRVILFSCLLGGAAGVLGTALTTAYLSDYAVELGEVTQNLGLSRPRPRTVPETYEQALDVLQERALPAVGSLFAASSISQTGISTTQAQASVMALTSDGWVLSQSGRVGDVMAFAGQTCEADDALVEPMFGFVFLHCSSSDRPVVDFASGYALRAGDQLFVVTGEEVVFTQARAIVWGDIVRTSDIPSRRILLAETTGESGSAVFNVFGEFVGVTSQGAQEVEVIPIEYLQGAFRQVLESTDEIVYSSLGARGIDVSRAVGVDEELTGGRNDGFLLYGSRAVGYASAAADAGLQVGDIIISVEGVSVNSEYALDDLLAYYSVGDQIQIEIDRDEVRQELTVTLGELQL